MNILAKKSSVLILLGLLVVCSSCDSSLSSQPQKLAQVNSFEKKLNSGQRLTNEEYKSLSEILASFPTDEKVVSVYEKSLTQRKDWETLAKFYENEGSSLADSKKKSAVAYFRAGRYSKTKELSVGFDVKDTESRRIRVGALYNLGEYDEAAKILDANWEAIKAGKRVDEYVYRGMIHFYKKENDKALDIFKEALEIDPDNIPVYNGLSRVYSALGKDDEAKEALASLRENYEKLTQKERAKTRFVEKIYKMQEDYKKKRYTDVIVTAKQIESEIPPNQRKVFYQYLYNSYRALGREAEAREALQKARQKQ